jgi:hypothetical protein
MGASKSAKAYLISDPHLSIDDAARRACGSLSDALPDIPAVGGWREVVGTGSCGAAIFRILASTIGARSRTGCAVCALLAVRAYCE